MTPNRASAVKAVTSGSVFKEITGPVTSKCTGRGMKATHDG